ncbi:heme-dependent oxidative N-demethylase family protein [Ruegeria sp. SCP11]|uniref:heme-dependent oxidative N-demethylase family protein n=1 Tax=Ruegeria sp. SCP11 TaxID=3141378 RepID=UPI00333DBB1C
MTILQTSIPYDPLTPRPLPGIQPTSMDGWLLRDDAFAAQMQRRTALLAERREDVLALDAGAEPAAQELLDLVLLHAYPGCSDHATRPDGQVVEIDRTRPLETLCQLAQEDFCILQKHGDEHVLTGAILCFPASWSLSEKFMRPLVDIHVPVASYDGDIARRVQRLFDGIQTGRPLWRFNALWYDDAELYQPRRASERRDITDPVKAPFLRSERQTLLRLPNTRAVVFSIHTYVIEAERLRKMENPA